MFINLAVHSYFSILMSSISIDDIINHAVKNKQTHVCLVDINNMHGCVEFYNKAKAAKLHPIIGLQVTYRAEKVVLIAKDNTGYRNLIKISSRVMCNEAYDLNDYTDGVAIIVNNIDHTKWLKYGNDVFSSDSRATNPLALQECYFEQPSDLKYVQALMAIANDSKIAEYENNHDLDEYYMLTETQAIKKYSTEALNNLDKLIKSCTWDITSNKINFIQYDKKINSKILLQTKCKEGLKQRLHSNEAPEAYIDRLIKELDIIDQMHFNDYFLVVQDYVNFAKRNGILVGPGRGSAAGSLVSYVLGITNIDPIAYDLIFERFLNPSRATMPDIDIDFMDNRRNEVVEYLFERYGRDHVAQITTFQRMKAKMAIRDAGRVLGLELPIINNISKAINMEFELDLKTAVADNKNIKAYAEKYPELFDLATKFVNYPRQIGLHAAGVVISGTKLDEVIPIQSSTNNAFATQYSMEYLEPLGLIKMDILGLVNLTTINETIKLIEKNHGVKIDLSDIKLDDKKVFDSLTTGDTIGIFQLESPGMRNLIVKIKPKSIEDISITSALFRPGPQKNIPTYLANKANPSTIKYLNNDFKQVLAPTYNIIIYQEQVIEIVKRVASFSLADADSFRRAISKKNADKLRNLEEQFIAGAIKNKYTASEAKEIFAYIFEFANYGFNHSHSLAYSYISYWMAYLKVHYPLEYFTVLLMTSENSVDKVAMYVQSAKAIGIKVLPPDINESQYSFTVNGKSIIFGFSAIKGIGHETILKILNVRDVLKKKQFDSYVQGIGLLCNNGIGPKTIEILIKVGCFDALLEKKSRIYLLNNLPAIITSASTMQTNGVALIQPVLNDIKITKEMLETSNDEQYQLLGISFQEHPFTKAKEAYKGNVNIVDLSHADDYMNEVIHAMVRFISFREVKTKTGSAMAFAKIEDDTKVAEMVIFPGVFEKVKDILKKDESYIATIKVTDRGLQALGLKTI